jgi:hypothetical protein
MTGGRIFIVMIFHYGGMISYVEPVMHALTENGSQASWGTSHDRKGVIKRLGLDAGL